MTYSNFIILDWELFIQFSKKPNKHRTKPLKFKKTNPLQTHPRPSTPPKFIEPSSDARASPMTDHASTRQPLYYKVPVSSGARARMALYALRSLFPFFGLKRPGVVYRNTWHPVQMAGVRRPAFLIRSKLFRNLYVVRGVLGENSPSANRRDCSVLWVGGWICDRKSEVWENVFCCVRGRGVSGWRCRGLMACFFVCFE